MRVGVASAHQFAACPLTNAGGLISDIWDSDTRGIAIAFFSLAPFAGPSLGPTVGGFMAVSGVPWQDLFWVLFGFGSSPHTQIASRAFR
jgi:MFS family permease